MSNGSVFYTKPVLELLFSNHVTTSWDQTSCRHVCKLWKQIIDWINKGVKRKVNVAQMFETNNTELVPYFYKLYKQKKLNINLQFLARKHDKIEIYKMILDAETFTINTDEIINILCWEHTDFLLFVEPLLKQSEKWRRATFQNAIMYGIKPVKFTLDWFFGRNIVNMSILLPIFKETAWHSIILDRFIALFDYFVETEEMSQEFLEEWQNDLFKHQKFPQLRYILQYYKLIDRICYRVRNSNITTEEQKYFHIDVCGCNRKKPRTSKKT